MVTDSTTEAEAQEVAEAAVETPDFSPRIYTIALLLAAIVLIGFWLVARFTAFDRDRDLQTWQEKLNLIAESRTAEVTGWVAGNFKELRTLASNPSLQLYLAELQMAEGEKQTIGDMPQQGYLRNLLIFTAERGGFVSDGSSAMAAIPANARADSKSGLAVLNKNHAVVVSTLMQPATKEALVEQSKRMTPGQEGLLDLQKDKDGTLYIGFAVPIYGIQGEHNAESQMGTIIGIKTVDSNLFGLLKHPGSTEQTLESILLRNVDGRIEYLSPLQDGTSALTKQDAGEKASKSLEARMIKNPGTFVSTQKDYRGKEVLATARTIAGTPWVLAVKIDNDEALAGSGQRRANMVTIFILIIVVVALIISVMWWHAQSHRSMMMSHHFRKMADASMAQERLLRLVADHQPEPIYIVDTTQTYRFANKQAADEAKMSIEAVLGKRLADVRGSARAGQIESQSLSALSSREVEYDLQRITENGKERIIRAAYVPLEQIPVANLPEPMPGVLVVEQDISEVVHEREEHIHTQQQLVKMLVGLVDKRDPFAANHSLQVSELSASIAAYMELDNVTVDTIRIAGSLMNIGKIVVPAELLTKTSRLSEMERHTIQESITMAAELVEDIHFAGPVSDTLRQWQEKWDGTGHMGLKGEQILISARIIAVANAFMGMISPRSWRNAMMVDAASTFLLEHSGTAFDRRVVIALAHYLENHSGKAWLKRVLESKRVA